MLISSVCRCWRWCWLFIVLARSYVFYLKTGQEEGVKVLKAEDRVTAVEFRDAVQSNEMSDRSTVRQPYLLIDVRPELETSICRLPHSLSLPYESLQQRADELKQLVNQHLPQEETNKTLPGKKRPLALTWFRLIFLYRFFFVDSLSQLLSSHLRSLVSLSINLVRHWREKKNSTKKSSFYFTLNDVVFKDNSSARLDPH